MSEKKETTAVAIVHQPSPPAFPSGDQWKMMLDQCEMLVKTKFLPSYIQTKEQALAVVLKGFELGIPTMQAVAQIYVLNGKAGLQGELMLALIRSRCPGADINFVETSIKACRIEAARPGGKKQTFAFTIEDAAAMGLSGKDNYKKQPATMLQWRCVSKMGRALFSDILMGCSYVPEEMGFAVNDHGDPVEREVASTVESTHPAAPTMSRTEKLNAETTQPAPPVAPVPTAKEPEVVTPVVDDQGEFAKFSGAHVFAQTDETVESVQVEVLALVKKLMYTGDQFNSYVESKFGKRPVHLTLDEIKKLRTEFQSNLEKASVK